MSKGATREGLGTVFGMRPETGRWVYVALGLIMNVCLGTVYAWSVFTKDLKDFFAAGGQSLSATQLNTPFLVFLAFFSILMPVAGKLFNRLNPKLVMLLGGVAVGAGWLLAGYAIYDVVSLGAAAFPLLVVAYGVIAGSGVGVVYGGPIATSTRWFPDRKGLAVGLTVLGFGVSAAITAPLASFLISAYTVPMAFMILGALFFILLVILSLLMRFPPAGWTPAGWKPSAATVPARDLTTAQMLRTGSFYALWFCFIVGSLAGLMAIGVSKTIGTDYVGLEPATATMAVSLFALPNGVGRPLFGWLTDRLTPRYAAVVSFVLVILGGVVMIPAQEGSGLAEGARLALFLAGFSCLWMTLGGWLAIAPTTTSTFFGLKNQPNNYGVVFSSYGIGAIAGNLLSGYVRDELKNYLYIFYPIIALALIGIIVALVGMRPPKTGEGARSGGG
ncbi:MAG: OFA family MFS transporter [Thermoplasmata archaeon]